MPGRSTAVLALALTVDLAFNRVAAWLALTLARDLWSFDPVTR